MNKKLLRTGIGLIVTAAVGVVFAIIMELRTGEPVYYIIMKATAVLFGVGGPLLGLAIVRRRKK